MSRTPLLMPLLVLTAACADDPASPAPHPTQLTSPAFSVADIAVVMSGLNSPRGLEFGPEGALYVTEAGTTQTYGPCIQFMEGMTPATRCYSGTGSVARLWQGKQTRVATGLPSTWIVHSGFAAGPQDISFVGRGRAFVPIGLGGEPDSRSRLGAAAAALGTLIQLQPSGHWRVVADISGFEGSDNPAGGIVDTNPYGVLAEAARTFVVDAGGNSLLEVAANGDISTVAIFPSTPAPPPFNQSDAVPTRVRRGPDGALYVSTLSGVPFLDGAAVIYRVVPGQPPHVDAGGFKAITDFAFAPDGSLYVLQFSTGPIFFPGPGALIHVASDGTRTIITTDLFQPTGIAMGPDGSVYVANRGTSSGGGEVLRITP